MKNRPAGAILALLISISCTQQGVVGGSGYLAQFFKWPSLVSTGQQEQRSSWWHTLKFVVPCTVFGYYCWKKWWHKKNPVSNVPNDDDDMPALEDVPEGPDASENNQPVEPQREQKMQRQELEEDMYARRELWTRAEENLPNDDIIKDTMFSLLPASPAPSLRRLPMVRFRKMKILKQQIGMQHASIVGVTNEGRIVFIDPRDALHLYFMLRGDEQADSGRILKVPLPGRWLIEENYVMHPYMRCIRDLQYDYIPVTQLNENNELVLGSLKIGGKDPLEIHEIGVIPKDNTNYSIIISALNKQAAVIEHIPLGSGVNHRATYLKTPQHEYCVVNRSHIYAQLDEQNRMVWDSQVGAHLDPPASAPLNIFSPDAHLIQMPPQVESGCRCLHTCAGSDNQLRITEMIEHGKGRDCYLQLRQWLCTPNLCQEQFNYTWQRKRRSWQTDNNCYFRVDSANQVAISTWPQSTEGAFSARRDVNGAKVLILPTGEFLQDKIPSFNTSRGIRKMMASANGRWIVAQDDRRNIYAWEVRGVHLPKECTAMDRAVLDEFRQYYNLAIQRNKELGREKKFYLTDQQWDKFQEMLKRPECEVPHDWARIFWNPGKKMGDI